MALTQVTGPYPIFTDLDGSPLDDGYLYIGAINDDPETNPIQVFFDSNLTIPATQPIRTNNGYAYRNGTPALLYTGGEFSITIRNKRNEFVLYSPVGYGFDPAAVSASVVKNDFIGDGVTVAFVLSASPSTILATNIFINGVYQEKDSYTLSGNTITFTVAPPLSSSIEILTNETGIINSGNANDISYTLTAAGATLQSVQTKLEQYISVKDFGAVGDGVTDDTAAIQACFTYCSGSGATAYFPAGTYSVDDLAVTDGIAGIYCDGTIKGQGTASVAVIVLGSAGNPVTNAKFVLRMDQSSGDLRAVQGYDTVTCSFTNCLIDGFVNDPTLNHYAFWMEGPCTGNVWSDNQITLYDTPTQRGFGIALYGTVGTGLPYGGFFNGVVSRAQFPAVGNTFTGNVIQHGSYAVSIQAGEYNTVSGNYFFDQNHRSIYFANASWGNTVSGNVLREFLSSAVVLGYGSSNNVIVGNYCETTVISGEAAINITSGAQSNLISGNKIYSASNYGVYVSTDSINTSIIGNDIGQHYLAAIAVENDIKSPRPTNANYSRPNYESPPSPYTAWSYIDMTGVVIKNNTIRAGYAGRSTAAIYVAQITAAGNTKTSNITIDGNSVVTGSNIAYNLFLYEETASYLSDIRITGSDFSPDNTEISANTLTVSALWNDKISYFASNKQLDIDLVAEEIIFADGDTSPSVLQNSGVANSRFFQFANTTPTSVTNFDNSFENQEITVRLNANTTIVYGSGTIRTKGSVNIVGSSTNQIVAFKRLGSVWIETWRNF
jgi:parallel beta-helix repeat protein